MELFIKDYGCRIQESNMATARNVYIAICQTVKANELREIR